MQRVLSGPRGSRHLRVRADQVSRYVAVVVVSGLVVLAGLTVAVVVLLSNADLGHRVTLAGAVAAIIVLPSGPAILSVFRRRALRPVAL